MSLWMETWHCTTIGPQDRLLLLSVPGSLVSHTLVKFLNSPNEASDSWAPRLWNPPLHLSSVLWKWELL